MSRYTEHYRVFVGSDGNLWVRYEDRHGIVKHTIGSLLNVFMLARSRSPDWVITDATGDRTRHYWPRQHLVPISSNPFYVSVKPEGQEISRLGPMSEVDFWVEEIEEGVHPLHTSADPTLEEVGQLLRQRRMDLGLTQKTVASMAEMPTSSIHDIETGKAKPSQLTLKHIARVLGAYFEGPLPARRIRQKTNPEYEDAPSADDVEHYRFFHGVEPNEYIDLETWVPGGMVLIGVGKDVGYGIVNEHSMKDGWYVHDFGERVKVYRRARKGERADRTWKRFPRQLTNLGWNLGFTYSEGGAGGPMKEVKGSRRKYLAVTPSRKTLVVVGPRGVEYLMEGGDMRVDDWIRD